MYQTSRTLGLISADLFREKLFQIGFIFKATLIILLLPISQQEWFLPFIVSWIEKPMSLPWTGYLSSGGDPLSFPYGLVMFIVHLPTTFIGLIVDNLLNLEYFAGIGFRLSLLIADVFLLLLLLQMYEKFWKKILIYYWLSPIVIFITYWYGVSDIVPVALFVYSLSNIKQGNYWLAGIILAFSVAAKHSMIIGVPFIFLYLWSHNGVNKEFQRFVVYFFCTILLWKSHFYFQKASE